MVARCFHLHQENRLHLCLNTTFVQKEELSIHNIPRDTEMVQGDTAYLH